MKGAGIRNSNDGNPCHGSSEVHDTLLFYSASEHYTWNRVYEDYDASYIDRFYKYNDERGRYRLVTLDGPGIRGGSSGSPLARR